MSSARASDYSIVIGNGYQSVSRTPTGAGFGFFVRRNAQRRRRLFDRPRSELRGSHRRRFTDGRRQGALCPIRRRSKRTDDAHRRHRQPSRGIEAIARRASVLHASLGFQRRARCIHASHGGRSLDVQADQPRGGMALRRTQGTQRHAKCPFGERPLYRGRFLFLKCSSIERGKCAMHPAPRPILWKTPFVLSHRTRHRHGRLEQPAILS
ncbi:putative outer membrane protein [Burkholderia thailandensis USAMRU Malaysia |nr:putative outer membrane protein [Burkholderia thailandensis 2002721723]AHI80990.1 putative outer membrane protein [Burkholderia thailandensis E444]AIC89974.1 putative outer membrane protein [Burkholderia thailandensis USAMRU Malaysia \